MNDEMTKEEAERILILLVVDDVTRISPLVVGMPEGFNLILGIDMEQIKDQFEKGRKPHLVIIDTRMGESRRDAVVKYLAVNKIKTPVIFINASFAEHNHIHIEGMDSLNYIIYYEAPMHYSGLGKLLEKINNSDTKYPFCFAPDLPADDELFGRKEKKKFNPKADYGSVS